MFAIIVLIGVCFTQSCISQQLGSSWNTNGGIDERSYNRRPSNSFCPPNSECLPISSCPILNDVLSNECVFTSKIGKLGCGFQGSGLVCCPQSRESTIFNQDGRATDHPKCGQSSVQGERYEGLGAYPWLVRVGFRNSLTGEIKYPCTGTILDKKVILTAAHCALAKASNFKLFTVKVGEWLTTSDIDCGEEFCALPSKDIPISHVIVHPNYQKETYRNNIALLVLRDSFNYTVTAQPVCLPETWSLLPNNAVLVGWGKAAGQIGRSYVLVESPEKNIEPSPQQQAIRVPIAPSQQCSKVYGSTLPITDEQLCAGGEAGRDACSGFGGAPLLFKQGVTYYQVGILSFGSDQCGAPGVPSVYTDVRKYSSWIRENMPLSFNQ